jgi:hypothetical protein
MPNGKIDLTILKRMVAELEASVNTAEAIRTDVKADKVEWIVELNKATGLAAGVLTEAGLLMGDIQHMVQGGPSAGNKQDLLEKILGGFKGPGGTN